MLSLNILLTAAACHIFHSKSYPYREKKELVGTAFLPETDFLGDGGCYACLSGPKIQILATD